MIAHDHNSTLELRQFFEEIPNLLSGPHARFSFCEYLISHIWARLFFSSGFLCLVHGLAGTNAFLYDVYTRVSEVDLREIGLVTDWEEIRPETTEVTWKGIKRKYWSLDVHRIPLCRMDIF